MTFGNLILSVRWEFTTIFSLYLEIEDCHMFNNMYNECLNDILKKYGEKLQSLSLANTDVNFDFTQLCQLKNLKKLNLSGHAISSNDVISLAGNLEKLESIDIGSHSFKFGKNYMNSDAVRRSYPDSIAHIC